MLVKVNTTLTIWLDLVVCLFFGHLYTGLYAHQSINPSVSFLKALCLGHLAQLSWTTLSITLFCWNISHISTVPRFNVTEQRRIKIKTRSSDVKKHNVPNRISLWSVLHSCTFVLSILIELSDTYTCFDSYLQLGVKSLLILGYCNIY